MGYQRAVCVGCLACALFDVCFALCEMRCGFVLVCVHVCEFVLCVFDLCEGGVFYVCYSM